MANISRRAFIQSSGAVTAAAGISKSRPSEAQTRGASTEGNILVMVYLTGGVDSLNLIVPTEGASRTHYELARPDMAIDASATLSLGASGFGLHPSATGLHALYEQANSPLAIVQAAGSPAHSRSHAEAQLFMYNGTPGVRTTSTGWLTRHLDTVPTASSSILLPGLTLGPEPSPAFKGSHETMTVERDTYFRSGMLTNGFTYHRNEQRTAFRALYNLDTSRVHVDGLQALNAANLVELFADNDYATAGAIDYSTSTFNRRLKRVAQMIKAELGLRAVAVEHDNWDTHQGQGVTDGWFPSRVGDLSNGLAAFYDDMANSGSDLANRVTVVVMSEFGRKLRQNDDSGFGHGYGGAMFVLGGATNGGQLHGTWPGLDNASLYQGQDLAVTTDYRRVLSEVLIRRMGNPKLGEVFPEYTDYTPLGVVQGVDLPPEYDNRIPTAVTLKEPAVEIRSNKALTAAGVGIAATAGLVALRNRGTS